MAMTLLQQAAQYLKKALPLMLKYRIPTTPVNYALWYAYVSERNPVLNAGLDQAISQFNTCPPPRQNFCTATIWLRKRNWMSEICARVWRR
ncbi:MAG: hypothetical protein JG763_839 [Shewanella sp.]|nr:hypothetical protein [Shewanella sp.]